MLDWLPSLPAIPTAVLHFFLAVQATVVFIQMVILVRICRELDLHVSRIASFNARGGAPGVK